jgi:hypothetical protein
MDIRIPEPRSRTPFRDFTKAMQREHALCLPTFRAVALKAYRLQLPDGRWKVTLLCDACGGHSMILSDADVTALNTSDPGWLTAPCEECGGESA